MVVIEINTWQIVDYHLLVITLTVIIFLSIGVWVEYLSWIVWNEL